MAARKSKPVKNITDLSRDPQNANKGTERGRSMLERSLKETGAGRSILVDKNGSVIAGNKTLEAWGEIAEDVEVVHTDGQKLVVVQRDDLDLADDDGQARRLAFLDNRTSEVDINWDVSQIISNIDAGFDFEGIFSQDELSELLETIGANGVGEAAKPPEPQIDRAAELRDKWGVESGQMWQLGEHRVVCGDCTDKAVVDRVMGGEKAVLMATDPPYGDSWIAKAKDMQKHGYGHSHAGLHGSIDSDDLPEADLAIFLGSFLDAAKHAGNPPFPCYVWHGAKRMIFEQTLVASGYHVHQPVIWVKPGFVIGRLHYHPRAEWALHGWLKGGGKCPFYGERNQSDVWEVGRENDKVHPTQKPLALFEIPLRNHTKDGEIAYDPFLGSGTTLIACERLNRKCRGIEIDPGYVAVTLERWHEMTGETPVLLPRIP